ncbi:Nrap (nnucleolar associated protein) family protein [Babesia bovis T2Bo]|uniref:Nucleolar protein 6 n=1 Tax=Babesia bovis TaxID=5865 RepID=A7AS51_BABBO|nr:Nrap (nnucleolar associated protein) family protein [Babesia bovis T2Bo]EDO07370.1 Nrap (nnucleolar associated protein) family protein [Babesia bovis T2Bo]|eukprot:XP_001610938.1 hypothetical protein [Babesia bovis T2Bo]
MENKKRPRKRKVKNISNTVLNKSDGAHVQQLLDEGFVYGRSLPLSRIKRLIRNHALDLNQLNNGNTVMQLNGFIDTIIDFIKNVPTSRLNDSILKDERYSKFFKCGFQSYWSDYNYGAVDKVLKTGSAAIGYVNHESPTIDLSIELPSSIFNPKDYINYRYLNKRNAWLCKLYDDMQSLLCADDFRKQFGENITSSLDYDNYKVKIHLIFSVNNIRFLIRIGAHIPSNTFKISPLEINRNNVRIPTTTLVDINESEQSNTLWPTPTYNSSISEDLQRDAIESRITETNHKYRRMKDAFTLLSVWATKQGVSHVTNLPYLLNAMNTDSGNNHRLDMEINSGLTDTFWLLLLVHVIEINKYPCDVESFPLFLACLKFLASMDTKKHIYILGSKKTEIMSNEATVPGNTEFVTENHDIFIPQFYTDRDKSHNICHQTVFVLQELIDKARISVGATDYMSSPFLYGQLFEISCDIKCHYDIIFYIPECPKVKSKLWELRVHEYTAWNLKHVLEYGLKDRLRYIHFRYTHEGALLVMVSFDENIQRSTDVGPLTSSPECTYFRNFWGTLVETRSFDDGSISECLLWDKVIQGEPPCRNSAVSLQICSGINVNLRIIQLLLKLHFTDLSIVDINGDTKKRKFDGNSHNRQTIYVHSPMVEVNPRLLNSYRSSLMNLFNDLNGILRSLRNVPLSVCNVYTCSPEFAYIDFGPSDLRHRVLIELESSNKWPNEPKAIAGVKVALAIAILKELNKKHGIKSNITVDGEMEIEFHKVKLSMKMLCQCEYLPIVKSIRDFDPDTDTPPTEDELSVVRDYFRSLHLERCKVVALKCPSYSASVRLSKAFAADCLLPNNEFLCEMSNCFIFGSNDFMLSQATSGWTGFYRFLYLVAHYDWITQPMVIRDEKFNYDSLILNKRQWMSFFWVSTPEDPYCLASRMPTALMAKRFILQCSNFLKSKEIYSMKLLSYFNVDRAGYNFVITLDNIYRKLKFSDGAKNIKVTFDEAQYLLNVVLDELRDNFGGLLEIAYNELHFNGFHSDLKHLQIYVKINPLACIPSEVNTASYPLAEISHNNVKSYVPDIQAVLERIKEITYGLIVDVKFI